MAHERTRGYVDGETANGLRTRRSVCGTGCARSRSCAGRFQERGEILPGARTAKGVDAFRAQWGTNPNKMNAFGKCVSATNKAKAKKADDEKAGDAAGAKANAACKKQQAADAAKFAKDYKNFGQCVKAAKGDDD